MHDAEVEDVVVLDPAAGRAARKGGLGRARVQINVAKRSVVAPRRAGALDILRQAQNCLRQAVVEALVHLDVGVIGEEVDLGAVIEPDARVRHGLDTVEGGRAPLLHRSRVMRQLRCERGEGCCEGASRRARGVADRLIVLRPLEAHVEEPLAAERQADIRRDLPIRAVARIAAREVSAQTRSELHAGGVVAQLIVQDAGDGVRPVLRRCAVAEDFERLDGNGGNRAEIGTLRAEGQRGFSAVVHLDQGGAVEALAVQHHQHLIRRQTA